MNSFRTFVGLALIAIVIALPPSAYGQLAPGRDYEVLRTARPTADPAKIEVLEYFSWGCASCFQLHPFLSEWERSLPKDVVLVKAPVTLGHAQWAPLSRAFYALEHSGDLKRLDGAIFRAIHQQRINLFSEDGFADWVAQHGVDRMKFVAMMRSMPVDGKVRAADNGSRSIPIHGTPFILVDGKYKLVGANAKSYADWPPLIDQLIAKARADRAQDNRN